MLFCVIDIGLDKTNFISMLRIVRSIRDKHFEKCTIQINADIIGAVDFDINDQLKDQLFLIGYDAIVNNLEKLRYQAIIW